MVINQGLFYAILFEYREGEEKPAPLDRIMISLSY